MNTEDTEDTRDIEFEILFDDITMCEGDGQFAIICELMGGEYPSNTNWMLRSSMTIDSLYGLASLVLHLFHDGIIRIIEYVPSIGDVLYNPDIQCVSVWAQDNGWKIPEPTKELVQSNLEFWKYYWETLLIDSEYLDDIYGVREHRNSLDGNLP